MRETLSVPFKYSTDPQNNTISGLATVTGSMIEAAYPTFLIPGFAKKTIAERMPQGKIKICWQHDESEPIGIPTELEETKNGLKFTAKISQTRRGSDAMILARDGVITETSIGFDALDDGLYNYGKAIELLAKLNIDREIASTIKGKIETFNREHPNQLYRFISQIKLYEISPVTWGADPEQHITEVHKMKSYERHDKAMDKCVADKIKYLVDNEGMDPKDAKTKAMAIAHCEKKMNMNSKQILIQFAEGVMQACIDACLECNSECKECAGICMDADPYCSYTCQDCARMCLQCAAMCAAGSTALCLQCAAFCLQCAQACQKYDPECAAACIACAKACLDCVNGMAGTETPDMAMRSLSPSVLFEGKILSSKNKALISDCIAALQGLLDAAEPPAKEGQALSEPTTEPTPPGPSDKSSLLRETEIENDIADRAVAYLAKLHPPQEKSL